MLYVVRTLSLDDLLVVCPGRDAYPVDSRISVLSIRDVPGLRQRLEVLQRDNRHGDSFPSLSQVRDPDFGVTTPDQPRTASNPPAAARSPA